MRHRPLTTADFRWSIDGLMEPTLRKNERRYDEIFDLPWVRASEGLRRAEPTSDPKSYRVGLSVPHAFWCPLPFDAFDQENVCNVGPMRRYFYLDSKRRNRSSPILRLLTSMRLYRVLLKWLLYSQSVRGFVSITNYHLSPSLEWFIRHSR